jgi:hypothetical protein
MGYICDFQKNYQKQTSAQWAKKTTNLLFLLTIVIIFFYSVLCTMDRHFLFSKARLLFEVTTLFTSVARRCILEPKIPIWVYFGGS